MKGSQSTVLHQSVDNATTGAIGSSWRSDPSFRDSGAGDTSHLKSSTLGLQREFPFAHGAEHAPADGARRFDSYHCSRYTTQMKRLTETMFNQSFSDIVKYLSTVPQDLQP